MLNTADDLPCALRALIVFLENGRLTVFRHVFSECE
jgi:hypothetical protein